MKLTAEQADQAKQLIESLNKICRLAGNRSPFVLCTDENGDYSFGLQLPELGVNLQVSGSSGSSYHPTLRSLGIDIEA